MTDRLEKAKSQWDKLTNGILLIAVSDLGVKRVGGKGKIHFCDSDNYQNFYLILSQIPIFFPLG